MSSAMSDKCFFLHFDANGQPIAQPLRTLDEVEKWVAGRDDGCVAKRPLRHSQSALTGNICGLPNNPRTLVCHDMAGGYLEDRFVQGVDTNDCYRFYNWSGVDIFVYFSHDFVTIPPPCWTNAAHQNGVLMLGTVITEWTDGKEICEQFLKSESAIKMLVDKLVGIAGYYQFDGWLINIENEIHKDAIPHLLEFLSELTRAMHTSNPASKVIWYDSVTKSGALEWQNELNELNKDFFDVCDGIFLNYTWKDGNLERSAEMSGDRIFDIYVGVDCFGRECRGGGGFNTIEALASARCHGLSAAIFAPGWVYEKLDKQDFPENENKFWEFLKPDCTPHALTKLPITSTFCQGWGQQFHLGGKLISKSNWANMSLQSIQLYGPLYNACYNSDEAYCGGGSLRIIGKEQHDQITNVKILTLSVKLQKDQGLYASFTYQADSVEPNLLVGLRLEMDTEEYVLVAQGESPIASINIPPVNQNCSMNIIPPLLLDSDDDHLSLSKDIFSTESNESGWITNWYHIPISKDCTLKAASILLFSGFGFGEPCVNVGGVRIISDDHHLVQPEIKHCSVADLSCKNVIAEGGSILEMSLTLYWESFGEVDFVLVHRKDDSGWELIGATTTNIFRVCNLKCKSTVSQFKMQPVYYGGLYVPLERCAITTVMSDLE